jgi:hypothetical protein
MKQKDILLIGVVIFISAIVSFFVTNLLFGGKKGELQAETVQPITANFPEIDARYINANSIDPVKLITISKNDNPQPFSVQTKK